MSDPQIRGAGSSVQGASRPKLRSSCDGCGEAKVKCDRGQPGCGRCTSLGLACVYGISRKSGKPPRRRPTTSRPSTRRSLNAATTAIPSIAERNRDMGIARTVTGMEPAHSQNSQPDSSMLIPRIAPIHTTTSLDATANERRASPGSAFFGMPVLTLDEWPRIDDFGVGFGFPSFAGDLGLEGQPPGNLGTMGVVAEGDKSHSCARESYEIFRDLICPGPSLHAPEAGQETVSTQLDHVLHFNGTAMDRLGRILKCPCSKSGHRIMVHASILSRILIWYQQAAGWTGCASWGSRRPVSPGTDQSSTSSEPSETAASSPVSTLAQSTGFAVEEVPLWLGTFSVEDHNMQAIFRNQLVLSELKKMTGLVDMFSGQTPGDSNGAGLARLYMHVGDWLRDEHSRTVRVLKSRLQSLNEALIS